MRRPLKGEKTEKTTGRLPKLTHELETYFKEEKYKDAAVGLEMRYEDVLGDYFKWDHDLGFMWLHTSVANYRLTKDEGAKKRSYQAAAYLASRFMPAGNYFRAWNHGDNSVAIDFLSPPFPCLMVADGVIPEHEVWLMCVCTCTYMSVKRAKEDFSLRCSQSEVLLEHSHRDHSVDDLILQGQDSKQKSGLWPQT